MDSYYYIEEKKIKNTIVHQNKFDQYDITIGTNLNNSANLILDIIYEIG